MAALYILAALALLISALLYWPVSAVIDFNSEDSKTGLYLRLLGIKIPLTGKKKDKKVKQKKKGSADKKEKKENFFVKQLKDKFSKNGTAKTVRELISFAKGVLARVKRLLSKITVRDLRLNLEVASGDAAKTAIEYGAVCAVVYPFLKMLDSVIDIKMKKVDIVSAFDKSESALKLHVKLKIQIIILLITAFEIYKEYKNFTEEKENERKQH